MYHARTILVSEAHRLEREIDILETEIELGEGTKAQFKELERLRIALAETLDAIEMLSNDQPFSKGLKIGTISVVVGALLATFLLRL